MKRVDVFKAVSDKPVLNIMSPKLTNSQVPYICLIDVDKAISYDKNKKRLALKREYFPKNKNERFRYRNKHEHEPYLYFQRKRIDAMQNKLHVHYSLPFLSCSDPNYHAFISAVQQYLLAYNIFCLSTTIEGALINDVTIGFAFEFLKKRSQQDDFEKFNLYWDGLSKNIKIN